MAEGDNIREADVKRARRRSELLRREREFRDLDREKRTPEQASQLERLRREVDSITAEMVKDHTGLALFYAHKFTSKLSQYDRDDVEAAAMLGLVKAIATYDPDRGSTLASWALDPIRREVLCAVRAVEHPTMSQGDFESRSNILRADKRLRDERGGAEGPPSLALIASTANVSIGQVERVLHAPRMESLQRPAGRDGQAELGDLIPDPANSAEDRVITRMMVAALARHGLTALDAREYLVLARRYGLEGAPEQTFSAIAANLQLSREAVRQIEAKAMAKLLHPVTLRKLLRNGRS